MDIIDVVSKEFPRRLISELLYPVTGLPVPHVLLRCYEGVLQTLDGTIYVNRVSHAPTECVLNGALACSLCKDFYTKMLEAGLKRH